MRGLDHVGRDRRSQRGASIIEFALVLPVLMVFLFGIIDWSSIYANAASLRQGVRDGARQGSVGTFGANQACTLNFTGGVDPGAGDVKALMCLTKLGIGLDNTKVAIRIDYAANDLSGAGTYAVGRGLMICAQIQATSASGYLTPWISGHYLKSKTVTRIEAVGVSGTHLLAYEGAPAGANWTWCDVTLPSP